MNLLRRTVARPWQELRARRASTMIEAASESRARGDVAAARRALERALALDARSVVAHSALGRVLAETGLYREASVHLQRAVQLDPNYCDAYIDLGTVFRVLGDYARAAENYRRALSIDPAAGLAHYNLGLLLLQQGVTEDAIGHLRAAHEAAPGRGEIVRALVSALLAASAHDKALHIAKTAAASNPCYDVLISVGLACQKLHLPHDALVWYGRAEQLGGNDPELYSNRAVALQDLGELDAAIASYNAALELRPDLTLARYHRALAFLLIRDYAKGWPDYELRLRSKEHPKRADTYPRWNGAPGASVLVYREQGLGDELMFASCVPDLLARAGKCVIACSPKLLPLYTRSFPGALVCRDDEPSVAAAAAEAGVESAVPIGSLPLHFRRSAAEFPTHHGYLKADPVKITKWKRRLAEGGTGFRVGISWRGGTHRSRSPLRSIDLQRWAPILRLADVQFVSVQYTPDAESEIAALRASTGLNVLHWPEAIEDYDETAALVAALDLTLSVCTAVIHLAGALGRPVWVMAPYTPEWRYGNAGERMDWYPSARVFRQPEYGDWGSVVDEVRVCLAHAAAQRQIVS